MSVITLLKSFFGGRGATKVTIRTTSLGPLGPSLPKPG